MPKLKGNQDCPSIGECAKNKQQQQPPPVVHQYCMMTHFCCETKIVKKKKKAVKKIKLHILLNDLMKGLPIHLTNISK